MVPKSQTKPKNYVLAKCRLILSVMDTRVYRGGDLDSDHLMVVVSPRLKLKRKGVQRPGKRFDIDLKQAERQAVYMECIGKCFKDRKGEGSVKDRWKELQKAVVESAEQHLHRRQPKQRRWISENTLEKIEQKCLVFYIGRKINEKWRSGNSM